MMIAKVHKAAPWLGATSIAVLVALTDPLSANFGDYRFDAQAAVQALSRLRIDQFLALHPLMGSFSLILRAPFVAASRLVGGGTLGAYRAGVLPCLLAVALLGAWLLLDMHRRGRGRVAGLAVLAVLILDPATYQVLLWGHPEELLAGALCVAAVLAAGRGRAAWAGVLLGLALGTKQWTLLAILPVLIAGSGHPRQTLGVAAVVSGLLWLPGLVFDGGGVVASNASLADSASWVSPLNVWWPFAHVHHLHAFDGVGTATVDHYQLPAALNLVAHPLILLIGVGLGLLHLIWTRSRGGTDMLTRGLALLAALLLMRCFLDPWSNVYYPAPFVLSLIAWEASRSSGLPLTAIYAVAGLAFILERVYPLGHPALTCVIYLVWALPLASAMGLTAFGLRSSDLRIPGRFGAVALRVRHS